MWKGDPEGLGGKEAFRHHLAIPADQTGMRWAGAGKKDDPPLIPSPGCGYPGSRGRLTGTKKHEETDQLPGWGSQTCVLRDFMSPDHMQGDTGGRGPE